MKSFFWGIMLVLVGLMACQVVVAETALVRDLPPGLQIPDAARPGPTFDVDKATEAYLNLLSPEQRAKSDAYFEGGYWLQLWQLLYGLAVAGLLLFFGWRPGAELDLAGGLRPALSLVGSTAFIAGSSVAARSATRCCIAAASLPGRSRNS